PCQGRSRGFESRFPLHLLLRGPYPGVHALRCGGSNAHAAGVRIRHCRIPGRTHETWLIKGRIAPHVLRRQGRTEFGTLLAVSIGRSLKLSEFRRRRRSFPMDNMSDVVTCHWLTPTRIMPHPYCFEAAVKPWSCLRDGYPRPLDMDELRQCGA